MGIKNENNKMAGCVSEVGSVGECANNIRGAQVQKNTSYRNEKVLQL